jgi:mannose/cellobiose epimerase-like protein (N-acyl-D-glucosamine 2-epimerase family)
MFQTYFEDKEEGGLFHAASEDWSHIVNNEKCAEDQFTAARSHVIGAMITHEPEVIKDAELVVNDVIKRYQDTTNGGYFLAADHNWNISKREKSLNETGDIFGVLMHLYEVSKNDEHLRKALQFLDTALDHAWDNEHGGFFSLYTEQWSPAVDEKDLATQCSMLQHLNGSWKDGMDSPLGAKAAYHKSRAEELGDLILERTEDRVHGGFFTSFTPGWKPRSKDKEIAQLASLALTFYFHYHNMGPSIWGPRKGSHAYTGRPYPDVYTYLGPAPCNDPVSSRAYQFGRKVMEIGVLLLEHAWDKDHGGFYTSLTETLSVQDDSKLFSTQVACLMALNVAHRLTGFARFQEKLSETVKVVEEKCFDSEHGGVYSAFTRNWLPEAKEKFCGPNLMAGGILSMMAPVASGMNVTRPTLALWIEPLHHTITKNSSARFTVTVQNQGFERARIRIGGLSAPSRWMEPSDITFDLSPHECTTYTLTITPPEGMPEGVYHFELACMREGGVGEYVPAYGKVTVSQSS